MHTYESLVKILIAQNMTIATAESCTGGGIASAITETPGSSSCFGYGIVSYANEAKHRLLGVPQHTLKQHGAVSEQTAVAMSKGVRAVAGADIGISVTGVAGPDGGSAEKPVGLVYISLATADRIYVHKHNFSGERHQVREQTKKKALSLIFEYLDQIEGEQDD
ncbi:MAG: CinA family protein [Bacillota bacterium]|jgi:PncC family amidohydrolase